MHWIAPSKKDAVTETLEQNLGDSADQFRANSGMKAQEYSGPILGIIFLSFAEIRFVRNVPKWRNKPLFREAAAGWMIQNRPRPQADVFRAPIVGHATGTSKGSKIPQASWSVLNEHDLVVSSGRVAERFSAIIAQQQALLLQIRNLKRPRNLFIAKTSFANKKLRECRTNLFRKHNLKNRTNAN